MSRISAPFPERVGWYELLAPIGAGGMATVYLGVAARDGGFQRHVAVKMIHGTAETDAQLANDLLKEAKLAAKIRHPNVVPVLDVGEDPYGLFLVMEYVEGDTLAGLRRAAKRAGERIPEPVALRIVTDALAGLHAAHELKDRDGDTLGVVHRDFSPHNILVGTDGVSRLTDFGIAKVAYTAGHTRTGKIKGKIAYMAPEQARGAKVDRRCDVWAAGVVAWEALVGERLYDTEDEIGALLKIVNEDPPRLRSVRADLPEELDEAMHWALTRDLDARCPSADALRRRLLSAHPIADTAEVAEFVRRIVGPKLLERAKKVEEIRRLRGQVGALVDAVRETGATPSPLDAPSGSFRVEAVTAEPEADPGQAPVREDTTGATIAWKEQGGHGPVPVTGSVTASVEKSIAAIFSDRRNRAAIIGVASGLGIGVVLVSVILMSVGKRAEPEASKSSLPAVAAAPGPTEEPSPPPAPTEVKEHTFTIKANADIATLKVADKTIQIQPAAPEVELDWHPDTGAVIEAVSADGRRVKSKVGEATSELSLEFAKKPTGGGTTAKPPPKPTTGGGFADNPYRKK
ncbi:MAG: serine/threonine protein kinase [Myxococcales bacterium]|nr:serine/threonine protein kinase [Myxococcales bacterium]